MSIDFEKFAQVNEGKDASFKESKRRGGGEDAGFGSASQDMLKPLLIGVGVGLALGAGLALLFAPSSGVEFRSGIADKARDIIDKASDIAELGRQGYENLRGSAAAAGGGSKVRKS